MAIFSNVFAKKEIVKPIEAVLVYIKFTDNEFGTWEERQNCYVLEDRCIEEIAKQGSGEYDGHEFGGGYCILYMYGKNVEQLYNSIIGALKEFEPPARSYAIKRYGGVGALEVRVDLS